MKLAHGIKLILPFLLCLVVVAGGCKKEEVEEEAPPATARIPARDVLLRGQAAPAGYGAYGYVLFTVRPSQKTVPRFLAVCQAYETNLEPVEEFVNINPAQLMVTFWPLRTKPEVSDDCSALVANYDFARATPIAQVAAKLGVPGPVLVAWREPFGPRSSQQDALCIDMSDFRTEEEITRAFLIWKNQLSRDPLAWKDGFNLVHIREMFRAFLNTYGEQIVVIVRGK